MMLFYHEISQIASFVTFYYLSSYRVDAHCIHQDGYVDHSTVGCVPTISPAPTESPAPSPAPSYIPTDTQSPSHSLLPSSSPTPAPTTSEPSSTPTDAPTESPAPSPSPSAVPSEAPTNSAAPSMNPTDAPSESPSQTPSVSPTTQFPSAQPTGPHLLTVAGIELTMRNVTGEREMSVENLRYFENKTALYLQEEIEEAPGVSRIKVDKVHVTNQYLVEEKIDDSTGPFLRKRRRLERIETHLVITIEVEAYVVLDQSETLSLDVFFEEFFLTSEHEMELRSILEQEENFARGIFVQGELSSPVKKSIKWHRCDRYDFRYCGFNCWIWFTLDVDSNTSFWCSSVI